MGRRRGPRYQQRREDFGGGPGPRRIVEELRRENIIGETQLDTRVGRRAVSGAAAQDDFLLSRHFVGVNGERRLPGGDDPVVVRPSDLRGASGPLQLWELPGAIGIARTTGKIGRGRIADRLNGDRLLRDGTLPISALASKPWPSGEQMRRILRRLNELEASAGAQNRRLKKLERRR